MCSTPVMATPLWVEKLGDHQLLEEVSQPDRKEITCMALAIYFESRSEPERGQRAVGNVVMNRAKNPRFPNSPCGVLFQKGQFKFIKKGQPAVPKTPKVWDRAVGLAKEIYYGAKDVSYGALSFHQVRLGGRGLRIGNHIFH